MCKYFQNSWSFDFLPKTSAKYLQIPSRRRKVRKNLTYEFFYQLRFLSLTKFLYLIIVKIALGVSRLIDLVMDIA